MDVQPHLLNLSAYIDQNLEKDLPLSSLAKRVNLSPFHFHRKFGAYFGESLHQHIKRLRLERAAYSLVNGPTPVRQIARESGYKTVSAFSHAFSGFAGESPTRYRSLANGKEEGEAESTATERPAWVGRLEPTPFAFVRAKASGRGEQAGVRDALALIATRIGAKNGAHHGNGRASDGTLDGDGEMRGETHGETQGDRDLSCIVATSDLYGIANGHDYRIDVGVDATRIPPDRLGAVGVQMLPGGRYARFDFHCGPDQIVDCCAQAARHGLGGEMPRLSQYFLRFGDGARDAGAARDYRFFVPLVG